MSVVLFKSVFHFCRKSDSHEGSQHKKIGLNLNNKWEFVQPKTSSTGNFLSGKREGGA